MNKPLSFIHEGVRYTTLFCEDEYLKSALLEDSNVADCKKITSSGGLSAAFKKTYGMQVRDIPIINNSTITRNGNIFVVTGKVIIDGVERDAKITAVGVEISGEEESVVEAPIPVVESPTKDEEPVTETPTPVAEPVTEMPTTEEEPAEEVTCGTETVEDLTSEVSEEVEDAPEEMIVTEEKVEKPSIEPSTPARSEIAADLKRNELFNRPGGLSFGVRNNDSISHLQSKKELIIGGRTNNATGILVGGHMYPSNVRVLGNRNNRFAKQTYGVSLNANPEPEKKPEPKIEEPIVNEEEKLQAAWKETIAPDITKKWESPSETKFDIPSEPVMSCLEVEEKEDVTDNKALKEKLRSEFSAEVNAVIGDIPHAILGSITEFTMRAIDVEKLKSTGVHYCIDNRWHKCGNWYCIDVVNNSSRFFFNHKNNVAVEIPISNCKAWLNAVS